MFKLVSAGFFKLRKSLCFKIYLGFGFVYSFISVIMHYFDVAKVKMFVSTGALTMDDYYYNVDSVLFDSAMTMLFAAAVFTAVFIGREHGDRTIRNKLIVGHGRSGVYLSNLIVCITANLAGLLLAMGVTLAVGIPLMSCGFTVGEIVLRIAFMIIATIAVTAIMVFMSMLISSKAAGCAVMLISMFVLLFISTGIEGSLSTPEYYTDYEMIANEDGGYSVEEDAKVENPYYVSGIKRQIYEFIDRASPVSQLYHMAASAELPDTVIALASDSVILVLFTGMGILIFRKKNIK